MFGQEIEAKVSIEPKNLIQPSKGQKFFGNKEKAEGNDERMTAVRWNDAAITFLPRPVCCFVRAIPRKVVALLWCFHHPATRPPRTPGRGSKLARLGKPPAHGTTDDPNSAGSTDSTIMLWTLRWAVPPCILTRRTICVSAWALCNLHVAFLDIHTVLRPEPLNMAILVHNKYYILCSTKWLSEAHLVLLTLYWYHSKCNHYASSSDCHRCTLKYTMNT